MSDKLASAILAAMKAREEVTRVSFLAGDSARVILLKSSCAEREAFEQILLPDTKEQG